MPGNDLYRARQYKSAHTMDSGCITDVIEPAYIRFYQLIDKVGFIGGCSQVNDRVHSLGCRADGGSVQQVSYGVAGPLIRRKAIKSKHLMTSGKQFSANGLSDPAFRTGDQHFHVFFSRL